MPLYRTLDPDQIIRTLEALELRISDRFPGAGLLAVCKELLQAASISKARIAALEAPHYVLRGISLATMVGGLLALVYIGTIIDIKRDAENLYGVLQGFDSAFNIIVLMGAGAIFLSSLESRWKRQRALEHLHELRSIIHVIDMHQLTKDPSRVSTVGVPTPNSPQRELSSFELARYLDYCSELLSLSAKVAALYAQGTRDPLVIETTSDLAQLTSNLSGKIWQKITMVQMHIGDRQPVSVVPSNWQPDAGKTPLAGAEHPIPSGSPADTDGVA